MTTSRADELRYIPVIVDLGLTFAYLERQVGEYQVDLGIVVKELLKDLFERKPGRFGLHTGPIGAFIACARSLTAREQSRVEEVLHEALIFLVNDLTGVLPQLDGNSHDQHYAYHGDRYLHYYQPVLREQCSLELYASALDARAVHHFTQAN
jgi:hypothetical protein